MSTLNLARIRRRLRILFRVPRKFLVGRYQIYLTSDHLLPEYLRRYPNYDKFLPKLVSILPAETTIIDIGANVGDTLVACNQVNSNLTYLCIEPDRRFYRYLLRNIKKLEMRNVIPVNSFISDKDDKFSLIGGRGTKRMIRSRFGKKAITIDSLVYSQTIDPVSLIKSDTDGYDFAAISSGLKSIESYKPIIFMECFVIDIVNLNNYFSLFYKLNNLGYNQWLVLNNTGHPLSFTESPTDITRLMRKTALSRKAKLSGEYFDLCVGLSWHRQTFQRTLEDLKID